MTTEQCSIDSLIQKSRTESFARQLQNRLRTLSGESERDGLEDTSWNGGDQLSSSSDNDIYYDLDSYTGSPAEEATEQNFKDYITVKNTDNINNYPSSSSTNPFLNHNNEHSINGNDQIDYNYLPHYCSRSDSLTNSKNISVVTTCFCIDNSKSDNNTLHPQCSTSKNFNDVSVISTNDSKKNNLSNSSLQNGLFNTNHSLLNGETSSNCLKNDLLNDTNTIQKDFVNVNNDNKRCNTTTTTIDNINKKLENNINEKNQNFSNINGDQNKIFKDNTNECCSCNTNNIETLNIITTTDVNSNSKLNNNLSNSMNENLVKTLQNAYTSSINNEEISSVSLKNVCNDITQENGYTSIIENTKDISNNIDDNTNEQFNEDALCRLVDAVFSNVQDDKCLKTDNNEEANNKDDNENEEGVEETIESKRARFRRCSSLKTGKTPPGTPGCKKIVRFADVLGLDLANVRTFLDEIPKIPKSAYIDLKNVELSSSPPVHTSPLDYLGQMVGNGLSTVNTKQQKTIVPLFQQPSSRPDFFDRIRDNNVCLENAIISDTTLFLITGVVRVKNIDFHKSLYIRYSIDNWKSFADLQGKYVQNSCDGFSDKFTFVLYAHMLNIGQRLEFAVRYHARGTQYWDNNNGANYSFQCVPDGHGQTKFSPFSTYIPPSPIETWASFY